MSWRNNCKKIMWRESIQYLNFGNFHKFQFLDMEPQRFIYGEKIASHFERGHHASNTDCSIDWAYEFSESIPSNMPKSWIHHWILSILDALHRRQSEAGMQGNRIPLYATVKKIVISTDCRVSKTLAPNGFGCVEIITYSSPDFHPKYL